LSFAKEKLVYKFLQHFMRLSCVFKLELRKTEKKKKKKKRHTGAGELRVEGEDDNHKFYGLD